MNLNKVQLIGRLTRDPEVRTTQGGQTITTISLATNRTWTDKSGQKQEASEFHNIVLWGKVAEIAGQYLVKGQEAYFEGRLQTRKYTTKEGQDRYTTEIVADQMQFGQKPTPRDGIRTATYAPAPRPADRGGMRAPAAAATAAVAAATVAPEEIPTINLDDEDKDEIRIEDVPF